MERSPIRDIEIKYILKNALTEKINDSYVFMKGIDNSYHYEGHMTYKTKDLASSEKISSLAEMKKSALNKMNNLENKSNQKKKEKDVCK